MTKPPLRPVALTIDGKAVTVPEGTTLREACETQGIDTAPDTAQGLAAVDLNGDGKLDLALTESSVDHAAVTILLAK